MHAESPTILIFGDSLSAGYGIDIDQSWSALLQVRLEQQGYEYHVANASISGETTEGGASRIAAALEDFSPEVVVIELGGNDGLRGLPTDRMQKNLETMIKASRKRGAAVVLLGMRIPPNYGPRYTRAFEQVFRDLADEFDLSLIDFFMKGIALDDELMQSDGIHPNAKGQPLLLDNAWPAITAVLRRQGGVGRAATQ